MKKKKKRAVVLGDFPDCTFRHNVACPENKRDCARCGWNPKVDKARLSTFCRDHSINIMEVI